MVTRYELTSRDVENIQFVEDFIEKAEKKKGPDWKKVKGLVGWVGKVGFNACVSKLSGVSGISDAKAVCGALKGKARKEGRLSPEHMGRKEKKAKK
jgi:hypothetical protein